MELQRISTREFRNNIAKYLLGKDPVVVLRHGQTIGYYIPVTAKEADLELEHLKLAASRLDALLKERGISEDELVEEFQRLRAKDREE